MCRKEMHSYRRLNHKKRCCRTSNVVWSSRAKSFVPGFSELSLRLVNLLLWIPCFPSNRYHWITQGLVIQILYLTSSACNLYEILQVTEVIFLSETKENKAYILKLIHNIILSLFSSVQFSHSVMSDSLRPHEPQHARPLWPSPTPRVHSNSCPSSWWCHLILCHPLLLLPPNPSQHQGLFQWVNSLHDMAKVLEFQLQHQSFQWTARTYLF